MAPPLVFLPVLFNGRKDLPLVIGESKFII